MLREAELFGMAEQMLVEVLGRIRAANNDIVLPPLRRGAPGLTMTQAVQRYVQDEGHLAALLAGAGAIGVRDVITEDCGRTSGASLDRLAGGGGPVAQASAAARAAVGSVVTADARVETGEGVLTVRDYLLRAIVERVLLAHYVAAYLGSTACPLPEELARPLWELTAPSVARWQELGYFRAPMPLPDHVSWRDRFLLTAGHEPHPVGH